MSARDPYLQPNGVLRNKLGLEEQGADIFKRLKKANNLQGLDAERFCKKAADLYCDLNMLHPFREGNGRTQHMLIYQVAKNAGYELDMANVDREKLMARAILGAVDSRFMEGLMRETIKEMPKEKYPKRKVLVKGRMDEDKSKGRE